MTFLEHNANKFSSFVDFALYLLSDFIHVYGREINIKSLGKKVITCRKI